jgi:hypothetical protein
MNKVYNPCTKCVCIPICRHKTFTQLLKDCKLVDIYLIKHGSAYNVMTVLNPTIWEVEKLGVNYLIKELDL